MTLKSNSENKTIKNILIIGSKALGSLENCYYRAFRELGIKGIEIFNTDSYKYNRKKNHLIHRAISLGITPLSNYRISSGLIERLKQKNFDLIIVFKGM